MKDSLVVLVSGGKGGIGQALARRLSHDGQRVCVLYHKTPQGEAEAFAASLGEGHLALRCDLTTPLDVVAAVQAAHTYFGKIDVCVHAAVSPLVRKRAESISNADFRAQFEVSVWGGLALFQAVLPHFRAQGSGRLIGITSAALDAPGPSGMAGYVAAKAALRSVLHELRAECAPTIVVDEVAPAFVDTPLQGDLPPAVREFMLRAPSQTPEEVAAQIAQLLQT